MAFNFAASNRTVGMYHVDSYAIRILGPPQTASDSFPWPRARLEFELVLLLT